MREYFARVTTVLLAIFLCLLSSTAFAAGKDGLEQNAVIPLPNADAKTIKGDFIGRSSHGNTSIRAAVEKLNNLNVLVYLITDNLVANTAAALTGEDITIDNLGNAEVYNFAGLEKALADDGVHCIKINNDIAISKTLTINRSIRITADNKKSLLLLPGVKGRHLILDGNGMDVSIENIVFFGGSVEEGGGIAAQGQKNRLQLKSSEFIGNTCSVADGDEAKGGAIAIESSTTDICDYEVLIEGCKFEGNNAGQLNNAGLGGAIYINAASGNLAITDSVFIHNQSGNRGGAIAFYAQGEQSLEITDCLFDSNASTDGGALYLVSGGDANAAKLTARLLDTNISKNIANNGSQDSALRNGSGGGLYVSAASADSSVQLSLESGSIQQNLSHNYGGGICLNAGVEGSINAVLKGGLLLDGNRVDMMDGKGGGLAALGSESISLSIEEADISNNDAQFGGGLYLEGIPDSKATASLGDKCSIRNNKANHGGGVMLAENALLMASGGCSINGNIARFNGGGLHIKENSLARLNDGSISSNKAESGESSSNRAGGGIYISENGSAELNGCTIESNVSESGGGIFSYGRVDMNGCHVKTNAAVYGGGVYVGEQGMLTLEGGAFEGNNAHVLFDSQNISGGEGGAIYTADGSYANVTATGTTFADNNAESGGYTLLDGDERSGIELLSDSVYTTPFQSPYNNFDINNRQGAMATLYTIRVEYNYSDHDGQPLVEQVDRVFEGSELLPALITGLGEDWLNLHRKDGYNEGYSHFDFETNAIVNTDMLIKVVYNGNGNIQPDLGESPAIVQPEENEKDGRILITPKPDNMAADPQAQQEPTEIAANIDMDDNDSGNIPPSNEIAMAVPAPLPEGFANKQWGVFNAVFAVASVFTGICMLFSIAAPSKRRRRLRSDCLAYKTAGVLLSVVSSLVFALTQNTSLPANAFDRWTPVLVAVLLMQMLLALAMYYKSIKRRAKAKARRAKPQPRQKRLTNAV